MFNLYLALDNLLRRSFIMDGSKGASSICFLCAFTYIGSKICNLSVGAVKRILFSSNLRYSHLYFTSNLCSYRFIEYHNVLNKYIYKYFLFQFLY